MAALTVLAKSRPVANPSAGRDALQNARIRSAFVSDDVE
jgi:hypothetical protein